jgi:hypothetical protein
VSDFDQSWAIAGTDCVDGCLFSSSVRPGKCHRNVSNMSSKKLT